MQLVIVPFLPFFSLLLSSSSPSRSPPFSSYSSSSSSFFLLLFLDVVFFIYCFFGLTELGTTSGMLSSSGDRGSSRCGPSDTGKLTTSLPRVLLPAISCSLSGVPLRTNFTADSSPKFGKFELRLRLETVTLLGESPRAFQCCMDHIFNFKYLTVVSLSRSPGLSLRPAGLRIQDPCQVPWVQVASAGALCLRVGAPAGRFAADNWPSNAVRITSVSSTFFLLAYL